MRSERAAPTELRNITLAVLAGGAGKRMGLPKSALRINDEPILRWLLRHYAWPGPTLLITAPGTPHSDGADAFDHRETDAVESNGPLEGMRTALKHAATETVAIVTVDMPHVEASQLAWLANELDKSPSRMGLMCRPARTPNEIEPFPSVFRRTALSLVESNLSSGRRAARSLCDENLIASIAAPNHWATDVWLNLNYPHQLAAFSETQKQIEVRP